MIQPSAQRPYKYSLSKLEEKNLEKSYSITAYKDSLRLSEGGRHSTISALTVRTYAPTYANGLTGADPDQISNTKVFKYKGKIRL